MTNQFASTAMVARRVIELWRHRGILAAATTGMGLSIATMPPFVLGVFAGPMTRELGWTLQVFQTANLFTSLGILAAAPLGGLLLDRFGVRRVALTGIITYGVALAAFSQVSASAWTFYAIMLLVTLLSGGTLSITWTRLINANFVSRRGTALGIALSGSGLAATFLPALSYTLIVKLGWRSAWIALASLPLLIAWPMVWRFVAGKDAGKDTGKTATSTEQIRGAVPLAGVNVRTALRMRQVWVLAGSLALMSFCLGGWTANLVPILMTKGLDAGAAAKLAGVLGLSLIFGRIGSGMLLDRFRAPAIAVLVFMLPAVGFNLLRIEQPTLLALGFAVALCGVAAGAEYDFLGYLVGRYFGLAHYGKIFGLIILPITVATSSGAVVVGRILDQHGSFMAALPALTILVTIGALLPLALGRRSNSGAAS